MSAQSNPATIFRAASSCLFLYGLKYNYTYTEKEELHVIEGKGGEPDVHVGPPPRGVGLQGHAQPAVVRQVLPQGEVPVHLRV